MANRGAHELRAVGAHLLSELLPARVQLAQHVGASGLVNLAEQSLPGHDGHAQRDAHDSRRDAEPITATQRGAVRARVLNDSRAAEPSNGSCPLNTAQVASNPLTVQILTARQRMSRRVG